MTVEVAVKESMSVSEALRIAEETESGYTRQDMRRALRVLAQETVAAQKMTEMLKNWI